MLTRLRVTATGTPLTPEQYMHKPAFLPPEVVSSCWSLLTQLHQSQANPASAAHSLHPICVFDAMSRQDLPKELTLEQDIGDSRASLLTVPSSLAAVSSTSLSSFDSPVPPPKAPPQSLGIKKKKSQTHLHSPSSPNLPNFTIPNSRLVSRSNTLPRSFQHENSSQGKRSEVDDIPVDESAAEQMRRWVLGIAIGVFIVSVATCNSFSMWFVVDFDLDEGPLISGIYPPLELHPAEIENMSVSCFHTCLLSG